MVSDMHPTKGSGILEFVLGIVTISVIIAVIVLSYAFLAVISKITFAELDLQTIAIISSIFIPLTFLVFIDVIKTEQWKKANHNMIPILIFILLVAALYLLFGGAVLSIVNPLQSVSMIIIAISLSVIILVILLAIFIRMNLSVN
ncbi:MAG: hypothetical protein QXE51_03695 [Nitrososphaeria archaeon]